MMSTLDFILSSEHLAPLFFFIKHSLVIDSTLHFTLSVSLNVSLFTLVKERSGLSSPGA